MNGSFEIEPFPVGNRRGEDDERGVGDEVGVTISSGGGVESEDGGDGESGEAGELGDAGDSCTYGSMKCFMSGTGDCFLLDFGGEWMFGSHESSIPSS